MTWMSLNCDMARFFSISHPKPPAPLHLWSVDGESRARGGIDQHYPARPMSASPQDVGAPRGHLQDFELLKLGEGLFRRGIWVGKRAGVASDLVEISPA